MIVIIRIKGKVKIPTDVENTLDRLSLRKKYTCTLIDEKDESKIGMLKIVRNFVAYGKIDEKTLISLVKERAKKELKDERIESEKAEKIAKMIFAGKTMKENGIKSYFRLHPPRRGIKSKLHYPKGVLGDNQEKINDLTMRML